MVLRSEEMAGTMAVMCVCWLLAGCAPKPETDTNPRPERTRDRVVEHRTSVSMKDGERWLQLSIHNPHTYALTNVRCLVVFKSKIQGTQFSPILPMQTVDGKALTRYTPRFLGEEHAFFSYPEFPPLLSVDAFFSLEDAYEEDPIAYCQCYGLDDKAPESAGSDVSP